MCGRFTLTKVPDGWEDALGMDAFDWPSARYNVAPGQPILTIIKDAEQPQPIPQFLEWGLLPAWAKDPKGGARPINARAETAAEKPSFRAAMRHHRCLIPADGFFEWTGRGAERRPIYFQLRSGEAFAMAGLWEHWEGPGDHMIDSCTILTTAPNTVVKPYHHRMPVILSPGDFKLWLDEGVQSAKLIHHLLKPFPSEAMMATAVGRRVNSPRYDDESCILPTELELGLDDAD